IMVGSGCPQAPYRMTPAAVPGTFEAEDFDIGGQGIAYNDADSNNNGGAYRPGEGVDLEGTSDAGSGFDVGWTVPGEWIEYSLDVTAGTYDIELRVASLSDGGTLHIESDGIDETGPITFAATGGWQNWTTIRVEDVTLHAGMQTMRLVIDAGEFNINKISVVEPPDTDADGVPDRADACVLSDLSPTVIIDGCNSETSNLLGADGCTFSDRISEAAAGALNHGGFVSSVSQLMNAAKKAGLVSGAQRAAVVSCAARSDLPSVDRRRSSRSVPARSMTGIRDRR
ncbi:MAG: carbohydrate-binding protein, partial [Acidobacteriota bacterium]|nr:carbohydrate-binding protein [Acidobacteriota bacterium]